MANIYRAPGIEGKSTTLSTGITAAAESMTLDNVANINYPSVYVIDRVDANGNTKSTSLWEYVLVTNISGNDATITRGRGGSTAQSHSAGAIVEAVVTAEQWEGFVTWAGVLADDNGLIKAIASPVSLGIIRSFQGVFASIVSAARIESPQGVFPSVVSAAQFQSTNYVGHKGQFVWTQAGALSTSLATSASDSHLQFLRASKNLTLTGAWAGLNSAPSTSFVEIDVSYRSSPTQGWNTIFTNRLFVDIGEFTSDSAATTCSLALTSLASGTLLYPSICQHGGSGDLTLSLMAKER